MENKTTLGIALVAIVIAAFAYFHAGSIAQVPSKLGSIGVNCGGSVTCIAGDLLASGSLYLGGQVPATSLQVVAGRTNLTQATTTICSILTPAATTTLQSFTVQLNVGSSSAMVLDIAQATTPYATTTKIGTTYSIGAGAQALVQASTSPAAGATTVFGPNTYLNVKTQGGTSGETASAANSANYLPTGACSYEFLLSN